MTLHVTTWLWGDRYGFDYVDKLAAAVARNLGSHRFLVCPPDPRDIALTEMPGCFARLRTFDPEWQVKNGICPGDRILNLDLDLVVTGRLDWLAERPEPFGILQGVNAVNPCRFNGSVWWTTAGHRPDVWTKFSLEAARRVRHADFPDDQAWLEAMIPEAGAIGPADGVYGFQKPGWPKGEALPDNAKLVAFFGWRDPSKFEHVPWVKQHWIG